MVRDRIGENDFRSLRQRTGISDAFYRDQFADLRQDEVGLARNDRVGELLSLCGLTSFALVSARCPSYRRAGAGTDCWGPAVRTIPLAASKDFFSASVEEMSGFGAPARTATPAADLATLMRPAPTSFPSLIRPSMPGIR